MGYGAGGIRARGLPCRANMNIDSGGRSAPPLKICATMRDVPSAATPASSGDECARRRRSCIWHSRRALIIALRFPPRSDPAAGDPIGITYVVGRGAIPTDRRQAGELARVILTDGDADVDVGWGCEKEAERKRDRERERERETERNRESVCV